MKKYMEWMTAFALAILASTGVVTVGYWLIAKV